MSESSQYELGVAVEGHPNSPRSNDFFSRLQHATVCTIDDQRLIVLPVSGRPKTPLDWLDQEPAGERFYYSSRDREFIVAGSGQAHAIPSSVVMQVIDDIFASTEQGTLVGLGLPFLWQGGSGKRNDNVQTVEPMLRLSRRLVVQIDNDIRAFLIVADDQSDDLEQEYETFVASFHTPTRTEKIPSLVSTDPNGRDEHQWSGQVAQGMAFVGADRKRKIVLSRRDEYRLSAPLSPTQLLREVATHSGAAFVYLLDLDAQRSFVGASPELLFRRQGDELETEAVAGTASRSSFESLSSPKQDREQQIVVNWLRNTLNQFATDVSITAVAEELAAGTLCHKRTRFAATLRPRLPVSEIFAALHPTPAVCGEPIAEARERIASIELTPRGMYSGVIGVIGPGIAECAVALRCALVERDKITFSAGAGLVVDSVASEEWAETEQKIDQLRALFPK